MSDTLETDKVLANEIDTETSTDLILGQNNATNVIIGNGSICFSPNGYIELNDINTPSNPSDGTGRLYKKTGDDGIFWLPDSAGAEIDLSASPIVPINYFHAYDTTGSITFTTIPITVLYDTVVINDGDWVLSGGQVTAQTTGTFLFIAEIGTEGIGGGGRSTSDAYLEVNTGGGFGEIPGTRALMYNRSSTAGDNSCSITRPINVTAGEIYRVQAVRHTGSDTIQTRANCSRLTIINIQGQKGNAGPPGPSGADGDITWEGEWVSQNYTENQAVSYLGSSYVCRVNTTSNQLPTDTNFWDLLAQKGDTGAGSSIILQSDGVNIAGTPHTTLNVVPSSLTVTDVNGDIANLECRFGSYYTYVEDLTESSTTSTTFVERLKLTTPSIPAGDYRIGWQYTWRFTSTSQNMEVKIELDDSLELNMTSMEPKDTGSDIRRNSSGFAVVTLTSGVHTFDIDYRRQTTSGTAFMYQSRLEFYRV